jgi:hypothetical protein
VDLGQTDHPLMVELRRLAPTSPSGQKRILSIDQPLIYRIRVSTHRGATWVDDPSAIVWLCAARRRSQGSEKDAYTWFAELHANGRLLCTDDDRLRDRAEAAIRLQRRLTTTLLALVDAALHDAGTEQRADLDGLLPCRVLVLEGDDVQEIWCALGTRTIDGSFIRDSLRDLLFAALERHVSPAIFEARTDWPSGSITWAEVVRFGLR